MAAKFRAAGLISLGQTTVPEWGVSLSTETAAWGVTHNPCKLGHEMRPAETKGASRAKRVVA